MRDEVEGGKLKQHAFGKKNKNKKKSVFKETLIARSRERDWDKAAFCH